jgi:hypothetical protein
MAHLELIGPVPVVLICVEETAWAPLPQPDQPAPPAVAPAPKGHAVWVDAAAAGWTAPLAPRPLGEDGVRPRASIALARPGTLTALHLLHGADGALERVARSWHELAVLAAARGGAGDVPAHVAVLRALDAALAG